MTAHRRSDELLDPEFDPQFIGNAEGVVLRCLGCRDYIGFTVSQVTKGELHPVGTVEHLEYRNAAGGPRVNKCT